MIIKPKFKFLWIESHDSNYYKSCGYILIRESEDKYVPLGLPILEPDYGEFIVKWLEHANKDYKNNI